MIASHNSFTFLEPTNRWLKPFAFLWKCQSKTLQQQYNAGVRYFDVRVFLNDKNEWQVCHGTACFGRSFSLLSDIASYFAVFYADCRIRIIFEKGTSADERFFEEVIIRIKPTMPPNILFVAIKRNWQVLYDVDPFTRTEDYTAKLWYKSEPLWWNIKHFIKARGIKSWARRNNPPITGRMIDDPETLYMMDYV